MDSFLCLNPTNDAIYLTFINDDDVENSSMNLEMDYFRDWDTDFRYWLSCKTVDVTILPNTYQTVVFNFSLSAYYNNALNRFDTVLINIGNGQTFVCIVISLCIMSLFIIIGIRFHSDNKSNFYRNITCIYSICLIVWCYFVIIITIAYFYKIYEIGDCYMFVASILWVQFIDENSSLMLFFQVIIVDQLFILQMLFYLEGYRQQQLHTNTIDCHLKLQNPSCINTHRDMCIDHHCYINIFNNRICITRNVYENKCYDCLNKKQIRWNRHTLTACFLVWSVYYGFQLSYNIVGMYHTWCSFSNSCTNAWYECFHTFITEVYGSVLILLCYILVILQEDGYYISNSTKNKKTNINSISCCSNQLIMTLSMIGFVLGCIATVALSHNGWDNGLDTRASVLKFKQVLRYGGQLCALIWGCRAFAILFGCVISRYFIISWFFVLSAFYLQFSMSDEYQINYAPLIIVGALFMVLILFYDSKITQLQIQNINLNHTNNKKSAKSSNEKDLRMIITIFSMFLQLLDAATDYNLVYQWIFVYNYQNKENLIWGSVQLGILIFSQIISSVKMGNVDNIYVDGSKKNNSLTTASTTSPSAKPSKCDQFMTVVGLGRAWMGSKLISNRRAFYLEYSNLKIYEICFESIPSVILQLYVALTEVFIISNQESNTKSSLTLLASIIITIGSMSFSIWRVFASNAARHNRSMKTKIHVPDVQQNETRQSVTSLELIVPSPSMVASTNCGTQLKSMELHVSSNSIQNMIGGIASKDELNNTINNINQNINDSVDINHKEVDNFNDVDKDNETEIVYASDIDTDSQRHQSHRINKKQKIQVEQKLNCVSSNLANSSSNSKVVTYSKLSYGVIYLLLFCDFYVRSFPFVFAVFVTRETRENGTNYIVHYLISTIVTVMILTTLTYQYVLLLWIKNDRYYDEYKESIGTRMMDTFVSYFTCLLNLLYVLLPNNFNKKNSFARYDLM